MSKSFIGMTYERYKQLELGGPEARESASEEIWAELHRTQAMFHQLRTSWYAFIDFRMPREASVELTYEENQDSVAALIEQGWAVSQGEED